MKTVLAMILAVVAVIAALGTLSEASAAGSPIVCDKSGSTEFSGVFAGTDAGGTDTGSALDPGRIAQAFWDCKPGTWISQDILVESAATEQNIRSRVNGHKAVTQPGEEFTFLISGHGGFCPATGAYEIVVDPGTGAPEDDGTLTGPELRDLLSGFATNVTITIIIDTCHAGGFASFAKDIKDASGATLDFGHLSVLMSSTAAQTSAGVPGVGGVFSSNIQGCMEPAANPAADNNQDGIVTSSELFKCAELGITEAYSDQTPVQFGSGGVGGIGEPVELRGDALASAAGGGSGLAADAVAAIAGGAAAVLAAGVAGGWYARRRWMR